MGEREHTAATWFIERAVAGGVPELAGDEQRESVKGICAAYLRQEREYAAEYARLQAEGKRGTTLLNELKRRRNAEWSSPHLLSEGSITVKLSQIKKIIAGRGHAGWAKHVSIKELSDASRRAAKVRITAMQACGYLLYRLRKYIAWAREIKGRDADVELVAKLMAATGRRRVEILSPEHTYECINTGDAEGDLVHINYLAKARGEENRHPHDFIILVPYDDFAEALARVRAAKKTETWESAVDNLNKRTEKHEVLGPLARAFNTHFATAGARFTTHNFRMATAAYLWHRAQVEAGDAAETRINFTYRVFLQTYLGHKSEKTEDSYEAIKHTEDSPSVTRDEPMEEEAEFDLTPAAATLEQPPPTAATLEQPPPAAATLEQPPPAVLEQPPAAVAPAFAPVDENSLPVSRKRSYSAMADELERYYLLRGSLSPRTSRIALGALNGR